MEKEKIFWKVGDVVWVSNVYNGWSKTSIVKATEKTATTEKGAKLRQGDTEGAYEIGSKAFNRVSFYPDSLSTRIKVKQFRELAYARNHNLIKGEVKPEIVSEIVKIHKEAMEKIQFLFVEEVLGEPVRDRVYGAWQHIHLVIKSWIEADQENFLKWIKENQPDIE